MGGCCGLKPFLEEPAWANPGEIDSVTIIDMLQLPKLKLESGCIQESTDCTVIVNKEQSTKYIERESTAKKFNVENKLSSFSERSLKTEIDGTSNEVGEANVETWKTNRLQNTDISNLVTGYTAGDTANKPDQYFQEGKSSLVLNISRAMSYNYFPTNSQSHKIIEWDILQDQPEMSFTQLSWQDRSLDEFAIPWLRPEKEKPTINRNINVSFMPEELNVDRELIKRPSLMHPDNLARWTSVEIESAYEEMGKELDYIVDYLNKVEDMESDAELAITRESSSLQSNVKRDHQGKQNDKLENEMTEASPEGQNLNVGFHNEKKLSTIQQKLIVKRPSLIHPDNLEMWSNARIKSEKIEMNLILRALSRSLQSYT